MRRPDGITLIAVWHFIVALFSLIGLCAMSIPIVAVLADAGNAGDTMIALVALLFAVIVIIVLGVAFGVVGWGLWQLKDWARIGAIVLAVLQLPGFPLGTIVGGLTLWYLLSDPDAKAAFQVAPE
jgi:uncharacterized membrane protein (DUF2068 family)